MIEKRAIRKIKYERRDERTNRKEERRRVVHRWVAAADKGNGQLWVRDKRWRPSYGRDVDNLIRLRGKVQGGAVGGSWGLGAVGWVGGLISSSDLGRSIRIDVLQPIARKKKSSNENANEKEQNGRQRKDAERKMTLAGFLLSIDCLTGSLGPFIPPACTSREDAIA